MSENREEVLQILSSDKGATGSTDITKIIKKEQKANLGSIEEYEIIRRRIELGQREEELEGQKQDREQRMKFATVLFSYLCFYSLAILFLLFLSGCTLSHFHISDSVLIALITTSFGHAVGLFIYVPKYLYSRESITCRLLRNGNKESQER